jgi:dTDP-4-dehydrorhamnose reductase
VGGAVARAGEARGWQIKGTSTTGGATEVKLDIRDRQAVDALVDSVEPQAVFLPAAKSYADFCETQPELSWDINVRGTSYVLEAARRANAKLVFFSSDYVFDGEAGPYAERDVARPICEYGRQKLESERIISWKAPDALIIRTTVVYGIERHGKNFIYRLVRTLSQGDELVVPEDQVGSPTHVDDLAESVWRLVELNQSGLFHVAGTDLADRRGFAIHAAEVFGFDPGKVRGVDTASLRQAAPRPLRAGMLMNKLQSVIGWAPRGYAEGLRLMLRDWKVAYGS